MLNVVFCEDGQAISDFSACSFVDDIINKYMRDKNDVEVRFSTEAVLDVFVLRVMEDKIPMNEVEFYYKDPSVPYDIQMKFNEFMGLEIPDGVDNIGVRCSMTEKIIQLGYKKIKTKRMKKA